MSQGVASVYWSTTCRFRRPLPRTFWCRPARRRLLRGAVILGGGCRDSRRCHMRRWRRSRGSARVVLVDGVAVARSPSRTCSGCRPAEKARPPWEGHPGGRRRASRPCHMRRRLCQSGERVALQVRVPAHLVVMRIAAMSSTDMAACWALPRVAVMVATVQRFFGDVRYCDASRRFPRIAYVHLGIVNIGGYVLG